MSIVLIREERPVDAAAVFAVHAAAFAGDAEARLVDRLRAAGKLTVALVAENAAGEIVGHVAFSPVQVTSGKAPSAGLGLAPLAVRPDCQRRGIGSRLVRQGLAACRRVAAPYVVVLGEQAYYTRFGFRPASQWNLDNEYGAGDEFMALELSPGGLPEGGLIRYAQEFAELGA